MRRPLLRVVLLPYPLAHDAVTVVYRYAFFPGGADYALNPTDPRRAQAAPDK